MLSIQNADPRRNDIPANFHASRVHAEHARLRSRALRRSSMVRQWERSRLDCHCGCCLVRCQGRQSPGLHLRDLEEIWGYIAADSVDAADRVVGEALVAVNSWEPYRIEADGVRS